MRMLTAALYALLSAANVIGAKVAWETDRPVDVLICASLVALSLYCANELAGGPLGLR